MIGVKTITGCLILLAFLTLCFLACDRQREGQVLAQRHCQSCHQLPEPALLDKKTWFRHVLPKMAAFLGFRAMDSGTYFEDGRKDSIMPLADWNKIVAYYVNEAPDSLTRENEVSIQKNLVGFSVQPFFVVKEPTATYVGFSPEQRQILFADAVGERLYTLTGNGTLVDSLPVSQGVVNVHYDGEERWALSMGVLYPSDEKKGALEVYNRQAGTATTILDSLQRPVFIEYGDLNGDSLTDIILSEFGNNSGGLSWFQNKGNRQYTKHVLRALPGAIRTQIFDLNKDGKPDILAMLAQGDEGVFVYDNPGGGRFEEQRALQLPPSFGSNYFELVDVNKDGHPDIVATNGDNGDYPPILKPYHGIRVYLNDGKNRFEEKVFLPMNGACKAVSRDFDGDGDLDIAAISYFPDYDNRPEESFLFWENDGYLSFRPASFPEATTGRWLTMDVGDMDADGDTDIILGNATFTLGYVPDWLKKNWRTQTPSVLLLKNNTKR